MKKLICLNRKEVIFLISTIIIGATILRGWVEEFNFENSAKKKKRKESLFGKSITDFSIFVPT